MGQNEVDHSSAAMLTLASKLKREDGGKTGRASGAPDSTHRVSIRDRLLTKGIWVMVLLGNLVFIQRKKKKKIGSLVLGLGILSNFHICVLAVRFFFSNNDPLAVHYPAYYTAAY